MKYVLPIILLSLFTIGFISADLPSMQAPQRNVQTTVYTNTSINVSVNHNDLAGLQGGSSNEYYHLNNSVFTYLMSNIFDWITETAADIRYVLKTGDTMTGNLNMSSKNINNISNASALRYRVIPTSGENGIYFGQNDNASITWQVGNNPSNDPNVNLLIRPDINRETGTSYGTVHIRGNLKMGLDGSISDGVGSVVFGSNIGAGNGILESRGPGTIAGGLVSAYGTPSYISSTGIGSVALGRSGGYENMCNMTSQGEGSILMGYCTADTNANRGVVMKSSNYGSMLFGAGFTTMDWFTSPPDITMESTGIGSFLGGQCYSAPSQGSVECNMTSSGDASFLWAYTAQGVSKSTGIASVAMGQNIQATANNAYAFGKNFTNSQANSFAFGINTQIFAVNSTRTLINNNLNQTNGNATINMIYGEMWNKSDTGFAIIDLTAVDTYVQIVNITSGNNNGFSVSESNLTATYAGVYKIDFSLSLSSGSGSEYGIKIFKNGVGQNNCYSHLHTTANQDTHASGSCILSLSANDKIGIYIDDHINPVNDPTIYFTNVNLLRIGN